jgi:drug/metabolite transporter (DMT)-like permease
MTRKENMDLFGAVALTLFALNLAFNQVVVKVTNGGFEPVFAAGLRSLGAFIIILCWLWLRKTPLGMPRTSMMGGILSGLLFAAEFIALFTALDLSTVSRVSIVFYSMPVWLALMAHWTLPGERLNVTRIAGLVLAMGGVVLALADRSGAPSLLGDLLALFGAFCWAGIAMCVRTTGLKDAAPHGQLLWQLMISAPILLIVAPFFGPLLRDLAPIHLWGLAFQIIAVGSLGFLAWFWLMAIYPASGVASFSFLAPVFSVLLGMILLNEAVGPQIWVALVLVACGIFLINRRA